MLYSRQKKQINKLTKRACKRADVTGYVQVTARRAYRHVDEEFTSLQINSQTRTHSLWSHTSYIHMLHSLVVCVTTGFFFVLFTLIKSKTKYSNSTVEGEKKTNWICHVIFSNKPLYQICAPDSLLQVQHIQYIVWTGSEMLIPHLIFSLCQLLKSDSNSLALSSASTSNRPHLFSHLSVDK